MSSLVDIQWNTMSDLKSVAKYVMQLSDIYVAEKGSPDIWKNKNLTEAYLNYFLPLNTVRNMAVLNWAEQIGFTQLFDEVVELGSGPGTLQIAAHHLKHNWSWHCLEASSKAREIHTAYADQFNMKKPSFTSSWPNKPCSLFTCSYVLNETSLPQEAFNYDSIMIIEPSTQSSARQLMQTRNQLIEKGYSIWGPCTHQQACPLLKNSKKDWCHFRVHWKQPNWFQELESHLPIKNRTLTFSYLLASRKAAPDFKKNNPARIIGDTLYEKGKTRQAVCRGEEREFLSWLKRYGEAKPHLSGELIELPSSITIKGNELRVNTPNE